MGGFGGNTSAMGTVSGPPLSSFQPQPNKPKQQPAKPEKEDPFAQFGVNVFRS